MNAVLSEVRLVRYQWVCYVRVTDHFSTCCVERMSLGAMMLALMASDSIC